jgi:hypothetical protein
MGCASCFAVRLEKSSEMFDVCEQILYIPNQNGKTVMKFNLVHEILN